MLCYVRYTFMTIQIYNLTYKTIFSILLTFVHPHAVACSLHKIHTTTLIIYAFEHHMHKRTALKLKILIFQ